MQRMRLLERSKRRFQEFKICHYMIDTGKCRLKQMVDGVCTVREERNGRKRKQPSFDVPGEQMGL